VLLPEVRGGKSPVREQTSDGPDLIVLLSPHGRVSGVYRETRGDLDGFGKRGIEVTRPTDSEFAERLAAAWGRPVVEEPCDHGVVVPVAGGSLPDAPLVACTLEEVTGPNGAPVERAIEDARAFAHALEPLTAERNVLFVASAHTSAALTPQAPLTFREEGERLDAAVKEAFASDVAMLDTIDPELWSAGGACGAGPLTALGLLFPGSRAEISWYDHPFGVGYLLASVA
jgi:hypothetical protein